MRICCGVVCTYVLVQLSNWLFPIDGNNFISQICLFLSHSVNYEHFQPQEFGLHSSILVYSVYIVQYMQRRRIDSPPHSPLPSHQRYQICTQTASECVVRGLRDSGGAERHFLCTSSSTYAGPTGPTPFPPWARAVYSPR